MEKSYIEVKPSDNYIIIKQNIDAGFIFSIVVLIVILTIAYIIIKNTTD